MLTRGYYEAGQEQEIIFAPGQLALAAKTFEVQADVRKAMENIRATGADIPMFTERCAEGNVLACQALMNRARQLGEPCPAEQVGALFPTTLVCDCVTGKCVPTEAAGAKMGAPGGVPMWAWLAGAGVLGWYLWRRR